MSDLEIYVRTIDFQLVVDWLSQRLGSLEPISAENDIFVFKANLDDLRVTLTLSAGNSEFMSLFISGRCGLWRDDRSLAHEAFDALDVEIRYDSGQRYAPAQFTAITENGEDVVNWDMK